MHPDLLAVCDLVVPHPVGGGVLGVVAGGIIGALVGLGITAPVLPNLGYTDIRGECGLERHPLKREDFQERISEHVVGLCPVGLVLLGDKGIVLPVGVCPLFFTGDEVGRMISRAETDSILKKIGIARVPQ